MKGRWIRLDTTWSLSPWLTDLSPESRLVWIELLCYCKSDGINGRVKAVGAGAFATRRNVTRNAVTVTLDAAHADEALRTEDGEWVFTGWDRYQSNSDAAERQRRYRERQKGLAGAETPTEDPTALRNEHNVTRDVTRSNGTKTKTKTTTTAYSAVFERAWEAYPNRPNNNKSRAWKAWAARIREGVAPEDLMDGVERYAEYVKGNGKSGTEYVKQASTFFGPDRHWDSEYATGCENGERDFYTQADLAGRQW